MTTNTIQLMPYLHFNGDAEEALNTYQQILGGEVRIVNRYDNPAMKAPKEHQNKVLHAEYLFSGNTIYASDTMPGKTINRGTGDTSLSLAVGSSEEGQKIFDALAKEGQVHVAFQKQFWGAWHGNLTDRFGIRWMVNCE